MIPALFQDVSCIASGCFLYCFRMFPVFSGFFLLSFRMFPVLFPNFSCIASGYFLHCFRMFPALLLDVSCIVSGCFLHCFWMFPALFQDVSCIVSGCFLHCSWCFWYLLFKAALRIQIWQNSLESDPDPVLYVLIRKNGSYPDLQHKFQGCWRAFSKKIHIYMFFQAFYIQLSNIKRNVFKYLNFLVINYIFYRNASFGLKGNLGKKLFFFLYSF